MENVAHATRPNFTPEQLAQADDIVQAYHAGGLLERIGTTRRHVVTHPIDNLEPQIASDRDDGIFVETEPRDGGYRVHITIADVAAAVPPGSPLAEAIGQRATTVYGPNWHDPQVPLPLENQLSLEHGKERLGLTVTIDLDAHFQPVHTEFEPVITTSDATSYRGAIERMESDPQFQQMEAIADGIQKHYFQPGSAWNDVYRERSMRGRSSSEKKTMEMVATYMLLANSAVARFFEQTQLPFIYRNFDENADLGHAVYSTQPEGHAALARSGLRGPYCHFTSPIRRAPDYFNGHMVHYVVEQLNQLEAAITAYYPAINRAKLHHAVWKYGPTMLRLGRDAKLPLFSDDPEAITPLLGKLLAEAGSASTPDRTLIEHLYALLQSGQPPYTDAELQHYADHANAIAHSPEMKAVEQQNKRFDRSADRLIRIDKPYVIAADAAKFSTMLHDAAITGDMPRALFDETLRRIEEYTARQNRDRVRGKTVASIRPPETWQVKLKRWATRAMEGKSKSNYQSFVLPPPEPPAAPERDARFNLNMAEDAFSVLILANHMHVPRWAELKRAMARAIKHDPSMVYGLFTKTAAHVAPARIDMCKALQPVGGHTNPDSEPENIQTAIVTLSDDDNRLPMVAPPFCSIGQNARAAESHARYSFLEHYAFGQLQPLHKIAIPNVLYVELNNSGLNREQLVRDMLEPFGASLDITTYRRNGKFVTAVESKGGAMPVIRTSAEDNDAEESKAVALRRLLRHPTFQYTVSSASSHDTRRKLYPEIQLEELVTARQGAVLFGEPVAIKGGRGGFEVKVTVTLGKTINTYTGHGPNKDLARRDVCVEALTDLDKNKKADSLLSAQSWVTELERDRRDPERKKSGRAVSVAGK